MKNRLFALTAAAVLAVSLTACGSKAEEPAAADTKAEAAEETAFRRYHRREEGPEGSHGVRLRALQLDPAG